MAVALVVVLPETMAIPLAEDPVMEAMVAAGEVVRLGGEVNDQAEGCPVAEVRIAVMVVGVEPEKAVWMAGDVVAATIVAVGQAMEACVAEARVGAALVVVELEGPGLQVEALAREVWVSEARRTVALVTAGLGVESWTAEAQAEAALETGVDCPAVEAPVTVGQVVGAQAVKSRAAVALVAVEPEVLVAAAAAFGAAFVAVLLAAAEMEVGIRAAERREPVVLVAVKSDVVIPVAAARLVVEAWATEGPVEVELVVEALVAEASVGKGQKKVILAVVESEVTLLVVAAWVATRQVVEARAAAVSMELELVELMAAAKSVVEGRAAERRAAVVLVAVELEMAVLVAALLVSARRVGED